MFYMRSATNVADGNPGSQGTKGMHTVLCLCRPQVIFWLFRSPLQRTQSHALWPHMITWWGPACTVWVVAQRRSAG